MAGTPSPDIASLVHELLGVEVVTTTPTTAGLTHADTIVASLADSTTVFVKAGLHGLARSQVRAEIANLRWLDGSFVPRVLATMDDPPVLVLEDLSGGHWPEPYPEDLGDLESALAELREIPPPRDHSLPTMELPDEVLFEGLVEDAEKAVAEASRWVDVHRSALATAIASIGPPTSLVHSDLWYPNICFLPARVVLVDWSHLSIGSPWADAATVSIDLVIEGRPPLASPEAAGWAAAHVAWVVHALAGGPSDTISDSELWITDNVELFDGAAYWFARELGVDPPPRLSSRSVGF